MKQADTERAEARDQLLKWLKPGDTVYTILRHVSRSGMQREIGVVVPYTIQTCEHGHQHPCRREGTVGCPEPGCASRVVRITTNFVHPNYAVARLLGWRQSKDRDGIIVGGCGMDMGFHLVYELSHALFFGKGYRCLGKGRCPSNYHTNYRRTSRCLCQEWNEKTERWEAKPDCPECKGSGTIKHKREAFDLIHTDGYALKHRWL